MQKLTRAALGMFLAMGLSGLATAEQAPATGLGQSWPNAVDVSANPHYHVYVFVLNGVEYIQVNELNGRVIGAVAAAGGQFMTLPVGEYAQYVSTPQEHATHALPGASNAGAGTTVYRDSGTVITAAPASNGVTVLTASPSTAALGTCTDPEQCSEIAR